MKVAISVPSNGTIHTETAFCIIDLINFVHSNPPKGMQGLATQQASSANVAGNRRKMVLTAREFDCSHILFIDTDMTFPPNSLHRLLAHDLPIVGANYKKRQKEVAYTASKIEDGDKIVPCTPGKGLEEVLGLGLGLTLIKMDVFDKIPQPWFQFLWIPQRESFAGEDVYFCRKCYDEGIPTFVDHDLSKEVGHIGKISYSYED